MKIINKSPMLKFHIEQVLQSNLINKFIVATSKQKKDIIIVPHGSLLSLPFEILVDFIPKNKSLNNENWL